MAPAFKRLLLLAPRRAGRDRSQAHEMAIDDRAVDVDAMALESATLRRPLLMPAAIFHQVLFDPAESTPIWARPRQAPAPPDHESSSGPAVEKTAVAASAATDKPKPAKRTRQPKASGPAGATRTRPRRIVKPTD